MPTRLIRGDLLDSERYWSVSIEARQLFVHLMLLADDFGCVSLAPLFVRRRCFDNAPQYELIDKLVGQLHDADLVRVYQADGARYGFIPRFRQRLQRHTLKHPKPPEELFQDDVYAKQIFIKINDITKNPTVAQRLANGGPSPKEKGSEVGSEGKRKEPEEDPLGHAPTSGARHAEQEFLPARVSLPLRDGTEFEITSKLLAELKPLYPAVDIDQALRSMRGWLLGNPDRRKTKSGIQRFIVNWLKSEQEKLSKAEQRPMSQTTKAMLTLQRMKENLGTGSSESERFNTIGNFGN